MHYEVATGTTYCPNTPENWRNFLRKKAIIASGGQPLPMPSNLEMQHAALQQQISRENKQLRSLRQYLPGHEPGERP